VVDSAFGEDVLKRGLNSEPIELEPGHVVVVRVKEHQGCDPTQRWRNRARTSPSCCANSKPAKP
jgi:hypothetical protein